MNIDQLIAVLRDDEGFIENVTAWKTIKPSEGQMVDFPTSMDARMVEFNKAWELFHGTLKKSIEDRINNAADSKKETVEVVKEVATYTEDSKIVAEEIKKMKSKNVCGPNGCSTYYLVPKNFIEKILK